MFNPKSKKFSILEEIDWIRRKNRIAKYRPHRRPQDKYMHRKSKVAGKPLHMFPSLRESVEFKKIVKYFIEPLMDQPSMKNLSLEERLDLIFCVSTRDIVPAVLIEEIPRMPGLVAQLDGVRRPPTVSEAKFPKGCPVFVRIDDKNKLKVEIENCEKPDLLFELTIVEYKSIINKLREIEGCNYRLDPPGEIRQRDGTYTDAT
jgi:hypothetical protein